MQNLDETTITQAVIARHANVTNERMQTVINSLVQHLHEFAREVHLTEAEWGAGIHFLTAVGHTCSPTRQEFILLSDTLGLSTLVAAQNHRKPVGCTEATVFGPFHVEGAPERPLGADVANGAEGEPCFVRGCVRGFAGEPIAGAVIEVWQADAKGLYDLQYEALDEHRARATLRSAQDGGYRFRSIVATPYPIPHDGPVGQLLAALDRHPWRPAHLHFRISAPGYETLVTHVFRGGDSYLDSDAVFGVRSSLVADWPRHPAGPTPEGDVLEIPFHTLDFDFVLNPADGKD
jgi:hydroxyquinol 1,2-dioxygenase